MEIEKHYNGKKVLVTGGLGFIGSNLCIRLASLGASVRILNKNPRRLEGSTFNISPAEAKTEIIFGDMCDSGMIGKAVRGIDVIFHLAGRASHVDSMTDPVGDANANAESALYLIEGARKNSPSAKIVYTGTRGQYGNAKALPVKEEHPKNPVDINGINKQAAEDYFLFYSHSNSLSACCLRLGNIYGPRMQMKNKNQGFISWFIRQAIDDETINVFGDGLQRRDFVYVDDVVDAMLLCGMKWETNSQAYNLGGDAYSVLDTAKLVVKSAGSGSVKTTPYTEGHKKVEVGDFVPDCSKLHALGWKPRVSFEDGLKRTIAYYRENKLNYW
ncbi:NAD-dependent epimerase [Candidatus Micrarchaeota archaeon CG11_big_fil_rev_8_21_14_0_20_47_5]|nr:MAG: hypothetical protein AUJ17_04940 [Candidatus Micrarchaeota archaeon CG1_02_47_40]PIN83022.1 MAG: NAD-dependent epimerase [Candidatus Micrarchaeota archaeon CG11_big_fil_rev_8_21_14_0_20_47_5]